MGREIFGCRKGASRKVERGRGRERRRTRREKSANIRIDKARERGGIRESERESHVKVIIIITNTTDRPFNAKTTAYCIIIINTTNQSNND